MRNMAFYAVVFLLFCSVLSVVATESITNTSCKNKTNGTGTFVGEMNTTEAQAFVIRQNARIETGTLENLTGSAYVIGPSICEPGKMGVYLINSTLAMVSPLKDKP